MKIYKDGKIIGQVEKLESFLEDTGLSKEEIKIVYSIDELNKIITDYIFKYYPPVKQQSDIADKVYYETLLRAKGINNLEQDIVNRTTRFYNGETIEEVIADVDDEDKVAYEQLLKVAIRTKFVQDCKLELKKAIDENKEIEYPKYPL